MIPYTEILQMALLALFLMAFVTSLLLYLDSYEQTQPKLKLFLNNITYLILFILLLLFFDNNSNKTIKLHTICNKVNQLELDLNQSTFPECLNFDRK